MLGKVGDIATVEEVDYFVGVLPPACMTPDIIQIGEACDFVKGRATYATLKRVGEQWVHCGECHLRQTTEP